MLTAWEGRTSRGRLRPSTTIHWHCQKTPLFFPSEHTFSIFTRHRFYSMDIIYQIIFKDTWKVFPWGKKRSARDAGWPCCLQQFHKGLVVQRCEHTQTRAESWPCCFKQKHPSSTRGLLWASEEEGIMRIGRFPELHLLSVMWRVECQDPNWWLQDCFIIRVL